MRIDRLKQVLADLYVVRDNKMNFDLFSFECDSAACAIGWHVRLHRDCGLLIINDGSAITDGQLPRQQTLMRYFEFADRDCDLFYPKREDAYHNTLDGTIERLEKFIAQQEATVPSMDFHGDQIIGGEALTKSNPAAFCDTIQ